MADWKRLKSSRATIRGQLTRLSGALTDDITLAEAQVRVRKIEDLWQKFEDTQTAIDESRLATVQPVDGQTAEEAEAIIQQDSDAERTIFEGVYYAAAARLQHIIDAVNQQQVEERLANQFAQQRLNDREPPENDLRRYDRGPRRGDEHQRIDVKLPTLILPEFKGEYNEWLHFKDTFQSLIHENQGLTPIQKFQYLKSSLKGEALQVIGGFQTTAANYEDAWELLKGNYENTRLLINTHLSQLLDFPAVTKDKPATIRQLIVHIRTHLKALRTLELPVAHWDELLIHMINPKLDYNMQRDWQEEANRSRDVRKTLEEFLTFLCEHCRTIEMIDLRKNKVEAPKQTSSRKQVAVATSAQQGCQICGEAHAVYKCPNFLQLSIPNRLQEAKSKKLCLNCLGKGHFSVNCKSSGCKKCQKKHNTLLHLEQSEKAASDQKTGESSQKPVVAICAQEVQPNAALETASAVNFVQKPGKQIILSTARVQIQDAEGIQHSCRVLLDPGSQSNLITENLVRKLKLRCKKQSERISGVNQAQTNIAKAVEVKIKSMHADYEARIECLVLPTITERLPQIKIDTRLILVPEGLQLADPCFHEPGAIDLLFGAGLFWQLLCADSIKQAKGIPRLQNTLLGWIVGGELVDARSRIPSQFCGVVTNTKLHEQLERFWNQEETRETRRWTKEEVECETQFTESLQRDKDGRFIVALPQKMDVQLGESESQAKRRLLSLERRFKVNSEVKSEYVKFMTDYEQQGHMARVPDEPHVRPESTFVLPHQPVIRPDSLTTKLRVVFDASAKTSLGTALNDRLMVGPNLQKELFEIILRFRTHKFVLTADIIAMFRQILVREEDRDLQRILWRSEPSYPIQMYRLNTVTYGTAPAPYLAIRCLRQLAAEDTKYPQAARAIEEDFYMDDVLTGAETIEKAVALQGQLSTILQRGKFQLRKWRSNEERVLANLSPDSEADSLLKLDKEGALKTLGLLWDAKSDDMEYSVAIEEVRKVTKRIVLSKIAQIFDPLGLLGPVLITAKHDVHMMQQIWQLQVGWDDNLPEQFQNSWDEYYRSLAKINGVRIGRNINPGNDSGKFDLIGFGDASEKAYGACLYAVSRNSRGETSSHLICSKSRVAPLKTISLPKLELNAALVLAKLCDTAAQALENRIQSVHLWSDSTIVLGWISSSPNIRKTYVANRVSKIQDLTRNAVWLHVPSEENPADLLSRGLTVEEWKERDLWWHGPRWLSTGKWPERKPIDIETSEMRTPVVLLSARDSHDILRKFSKYDKLERVIAYCLRFTQNALKEKKQSGSLTVDELKNAERAIMLMAQSEMFLSEHSSLEQGQQVAKGSKLAALSPFLDEEGIIRVGRRLSKASIPETQKHPIVLADRHHISKLIMRREHLRLHHCGPEQLLHSVRQQFWVLSGRREARKITSSCVQCYRNKPKEQEVMMGDLPEQRVRGSSKPFANTGVDYAGPLQVRESRRRGKVHITKAWIAVFTCLATKATHLELVTELTTEAFLSALRRFVARRGICSTMISDNGTNFVGAARELKEVYTFLENEKQTISDSLSRQRIDWRFIPPRAPHFGGLWEAAVKATKRHLHTITKGLVFTFEEYYTLLVEIESVLNSRPLTPLSSNPNDIAALTPSHFLVGDSLILPAEHDYQKIPDNRLSRWQHLQKVRQHFWNRWHLEYLSELQRRQKWHTKSANLEVGALVVLKEENVPPLHWMLGRVIETHAGEDNVVRVATVRTTSGIYKRAVKKLCPLPTEEDD